MTQTPDELFNDIVFEIAQLKLSNIEYKHLLYINADKIFAKITSGNLGSNARRELRLGLIDKVERLLAKSLFYLLDKEPVQNFHTHSFDVKGKQYAVTGDEGDKYMSGIAYKALKAASAKIVEERRKNLMFVLEH